MMIKTETLMNTHSTNISNSFPVLKFIKLLSPYSNYSNSEVWIVLFGIHVHSFFKKWIYLVFSIQHIFKTPKYSIFGKLYSISSLPEKRYCEKWLKLLYIFTLFLWYYFILPLYCTAFTLIFADAGQW